MSRRWWGLIGGVFAALLVVGIIAAGFYYQKARDEDQVRSRLAACEIGNVQRVKQRDLLLTLTMNPRFQDVVGEAFGPVDCRKIIK